MGFPRSGTTALLLAALLAVHAAAAAQPAGADLIQFHPAVSARAASGGDEKRLRVVCSVRADPLLADAAPDVAATWLSFLTTTPGRIEIAAITPAPIRDPSTILALKPRFAPLPVARITAGSTLDWAYVFDRNGDGRIDYVAVLDNALPVLPDPLPAGFPEVQVQPNGSVRLSKELAYAMIDAAQMVFRHYADENFDGRVEAVVIDEFDERRPLFIAGYVAYRLVPGGGEEAWRFRNDIGRRTAEVTAVDGVLRLPAPGRGTEPAADRIAAADTLLRLFNAGLARCPAGTAAVAAAP